MEPQFIWTRPSQHWKSLFMKLHKQIFETKIWQRIVYVFRRPPRSKITSLLEPTTIMTLLHRPSVHLNKSFTTLKVTFHEIAQANFEPEIWQRIEYFFRRPPRSKIISLLEPIRIMTLLHGTSIHLNKSFTTLKVTFHEIAQANFLSPKFDNVLSSFFVGHQDEK